MQFKKLVSVAISLILIMSAALLIFTVNAQDEIAPKPILFIGTVADNENEFVGLSIDGENVTLYICDGNADEDTVSIAQWFLGTIEEGAIAITASDGNLVEATVTEDSVTGVFTFTDGTTKEFTLALAELEATLIRSEFSIGEDDFVGGWLILPDGSVRGAVRKNGSEAVSPAKIMVIAV